MTSICLHPVYTLTKYLEVEPLMHFSAIGYPQIAYVKNKKVSIIFL